MSQYFPDLNKHCYWNIRDKLALSDYTTNANLNGATCVDKSALLSKIDLASLKLEVDNLDLDKVKTFPHHLSLNKVNNKLYNLVAKKNM